MKKNPEEWKTAQANSKFASTQVQRDVESKSAPSAATTATITSPHGGQSLEHRERSSTVQVQETQRKRKARPEDEIDELFDKTIGKKIKRAGLRGDEKITGQPLKTTEMVSTKKRRKDREGQMKDKALEDVIDAIKSAPKDSSDHKKKKRTK